MAEALLSVESLKIEVERDGKWLLAVRDVSFSLKRGERLALVGESGSGKSLTAMSIGRLLPTGARIAGGHIVFFGSDIVQSSSEDVRLLRGRDVAFVFQDPNAALDPTMRVGRQITESLEAHKIEGPSYWREKAADLLTRVGIRDAWRRLDDYPHQFSGGMRQRAMIAAALIAGPRLLVADEPTSALDVTVQAQIIKLINELSADMGLAIIFITHDLSVARLAADRVAVMYAGVIVEYGPAGILLKKPHHPYTQALLALAPHLATIKTLPDPIPGTPVPAWQTGDACPFAGRCRFTELRCMTDRTSLVRVSNTAEHYSACIIQPGDRRVRHSNPELGD